MTNMRDFASPAARRHYPRDVRLEPIHLDLDVHVDLEHERLEGTVTTTVVARQDGPRTLMLDAIDFEITEVVDADGASLSFDYDDEKLAITWSEGFKRGEERRVSVTYSVHRPISALYFSKPDEHYPDKPWFAATDHETERAKHWLPCIDMPHVRCSLDFHLRADRRFTILANGKHAGEDQHDDGTKTVHWSLTERCPSYLVCFAIGEFTEAIDGTFEDIPLAYYGASSRTADDLIRSFGRTGDMLAWMTEKLGQAFPYPKYYQFALPEFGGAMENISLVSWSDLFVIDEARAPEEWGVWLVDQINVHEMAHSYFGDAIVCRDYGQAWLKESWATYIETCWLEDSKSDDEAQYNLYRDRHAYFDESDHDYARPIITNTFDSSWQMYDRHLYPGGAVRLHMLRKMLGDDVFWEGVRTYVSRTMHKVVETQDFRRALEDVSGRSLVRFFEQWFRTAGYPKLHGSLDWDDDKKEGTLTLTQKQVSEQGEGPLFDLDVTVAWYVDGERRETVAVMRERVQHVRFSAPKKPDMVRLDPDNHLVVNLEFNPGDAMLRTQVASAADIPGRIHAAHELAKTGKRKNVDAIADAYAHESFWGVRQNMAKALGNAGTEHAPGRLDELGRPEQDPMVLPNLMQSLGKYRDPRIVEVLMQRVEGGLGPIAARAALTALGAQRGLVPVESVARIMHDATKNEFERAGAARALGGARSEDAVAHLESVLAYGAAPSRVRAAAASVLGAMARHLPHGTKERIVDHLIDLLRDPVESVHRGAARALVSAQGRRAMDAMEQYRRARLSHQEQVEFDSSVAGLRHSGDSKVAAMQSNIDELTEKLRKLQERLSKLEDTQE